MKPSRHKNPESGCAVVDPKTEARVPPAVVLRARARRLWAALKLDVRLQARNRLYPISVGVSLIFAGALGWLTPQGEIARTLPMGLLLVVGGSTLLYVVAMILLERADRTLSATAVSPLRPWEYLVSKVVSLAGLAVLEGTLIAVGMLLWVAPEPGLAPGWLGLGLLSLGALHVLAGVVLVVRYERLTEALLPMGGLALVLQAPAFYFVGAIDSQALLLIPSGPPTLLVLGSLSPLSPGLWAYGLVGTATSLLGLSVWALRAFQAHVVEKAG